MLPKYHIIINLLVSVPLLFVVKPIYVAIFFFSSVLIDIDHYFYYIIEKKNYSLKKAYTWFKMRKAQVQKLSYEERAKHAKGFVFFHGFEPLILFLILSIFFYPLLFVALGFFVHMLEDLVEDIPLRTVKIKLFLSYALYRYFKK